MTRRRALACVYVSFVADSLLDNNSLLSVRGLPPPLCWLRSMKFTLCLIYRPPQLREANHSPKPAQKHRMFVCLFFEFGWETRERCLVTNRKAPRPLTIVLRGGDISPRLRHASSFCRSNDSGGSPFMDPTRVCDTNKPICHNYVRPSVCLCARVCARACVPL